MYCNCSELEFRVERDFERDWRKLETQCREDELANGFIAELHSVNGPWFRDLPESLAATIQHSDYRA